MATTLAYVAAGICLLGGTGHMATKRMVVSDFRTIERDDRLIFVVAWLGVDWYLSSSASS